MALAYDRLWLRLHEQGISAEEMKRATGLSSATISRLRKNQNVKVSTLERICSYLDCSLDKITTENTVNENKTEIVSEDGELTISSFFSGIGGFELGFESAGFKTLFQCEIDDYCNKILARHWPDVARMGDISQVKPEDLPSSEVWIGGFPCQDVSVARGKSERLGLRGARSGLFHDFSNLIEKKTPKVVVLENVSGLLSSNNGRDFGYILQRMSGLGYSVSWRVLNSRYFGVPQSRPRTYVVCWKNGLIESTNSLFETEQVPTPKNQRHEFIEVGSSPGLYPIVPKVSYCLAATSGRHTGTDWSRTYVVCSEGVRRMTPVEYERLQGFPDEWTMPAIKNFGTDLDAPRYKAVGNAVSVPVIEWIAERIAKGLTGIYKNEKPSSDDIQLRFSVLERAVRSDVKLSEIDFSDEKIKWKWTNAGVATDEYILAAKVPPAPAEPIQSNLSNVVDQDPQDEKYYLTPNAAEGILRRCDAQNRTLFAPLAEALQNLKELKYADDSITSELETQELQLA